MLCKLGNCNVSWYFVVSILVLQFKYKYLVYYSIYFVLFIHFCNKYPTNFIYFENGEYFRKCTFEKF